MKNYIAMDIFVLSLAITHHLLGITLVILELVKMHKEKK